MITLPRMLALTGATLALVAGCSSTPQAAPTASSPQPPAAGAPTAAVATTAPDGAYVADYLPGLPAQVRVPANAADAPLVVMVPGGGWATADPTLMAPLATRIMQDGVTTSLLTYDTTGTATHFPVAVDEVACGVRWSAQKAAELGHPATKVIVLGHSAGGHLASLVAFSGDEFGGDCPYPPVTIDGLVGIAGVYNSDWFTSGMTLWMGVDPSTDPDVWRRANPTAWLEDGSRVPPGLQTLLIHGDGDENVPYVHTQALADALRAKGMPISATAMSGVSHMQIIEAGIAVIPIHDWLVSLGWLAAPSPAPTG